MMITKILLAMFSWASIFSLQTATIPDHLEIDDSSYVEAEEAGTYPVIYRYYNEERELVAEKTIYVTLFHQRTYTNEAAQEGIDARDIEIPVGLFPSMTDKELIILTQAHAWSLTTGASIPITVVERIEVNKEAGIYQVRFATAKDTATTVNVVEVVDVDEHALMNFFNFTPPLNLTILNLTAIFIFITIMGFIIYNYYLVRKNLREVEELLTKK